MSDGNGAMEGQHRSAIDLVAINVKSVLNDIINILQSESDGNKLDWLPEELLPQSSRALIAFCSTVVVLSTKSAFLGISAILVDERTYARGHNCWSPGCLGHAM